ncbi:hypothetical protein BHE74_00058321, partial [Ensete ventricosum]
RDGDDGHPTIHHVRVPALNPFKRLGCAWTPQKNPILGCLSARCANSRGKPDPFELCLVLREASYVPPLPTPSHPSRIGSWKNAQWKGKIASRVGRQRCHRTKPPHTTTHRLCPCPSFPLSSSASSSDSRTDPPRKPSDSCKTIKIVPLFLSHHQICPKKGRGKGSGKGRKMSLNMKTLTQALAKAGAVIEKTVQTTVQEVTGPRPLQDYDLLDQAGSGGPGLAWRLFAARPRASAPSTHYPLVTVWLLDKRALAEARTRAGLSKAAEDAFLDLVRADAARLVRIRHPGVLHVVQALDESKNAFAMVTEPVFASVANALGHLDNVPRVPKELNGMVLAFQLLLFLSIF